MQELIDWVNEYTQQYDMLPNDWEIKQKAKFLLKKEKEQMSACFHNGYVEGISQQAGLARKYTVFDDYYNSIFG